jgi:phenylpyruvate tautomerase PptA (4-oxalocrotonate tautomerase family)
LFLLRGGPTARTDLSDRYDDTQRDAISEAVHRAFVAAVGIPAGDRFHLLTTHAEQEIVADPAFLDVERRDVVYIQITLVRGRSDATKQSLYRRIAGELETAGVRPEDVAIVLTENGLADYSWGNGEAQLVGRGPVAGT